MKKLNIVRVTVGFLIASMLIGVMPTSSYAAESKTEITVNVDGKFVSFDQPPIIESGRTLVPMRALFESLGYTVDWDSEFSIATAEKMVDKTKTICHVNMSPKVLLNNAAYMTVTIREYKDIAANDWEKKLQFYRGLDDKNPVRIINGRTLMPTRAIAEALGCTVGWDGATSTVTIDTKNAKIAEPQGWQSEFAAFCEKNAPSQLEMAYQMVRESQNNGSATSSTTTPTPSSTPEANDKVYTVFDYTWNKEFSYTYKKPAMPTTAPVVGSLPAKILIDESKSKNLFIEVPSKPYDPIINVTEPYATGSYGGCNWYAGGRFWEVYGIPFPHFKESELKQIFKTENYLDMAELYDEFTITRNVYEIRPYSMAVYVPTETGGNPHVLFIEYVERDAAGNPTKVYFTEGNTQKDGEYHYGKDGAIQALSMEKFLQRGKQKCIGYIIPNATFYN